MIVAILYAVCLLIWGTTWYAIEFQLGVVPAEWSLFYRFAIASTILFAISRFKGEILNLTKQQHLLTAGTGVPLFGIGYILTYQGAQFLTSGLVAVIFSLMSFLAILNTRIFLKAKIEPPVIFAAVIGVIGLGLIFLPEVTEISLADATFAGILVCLVAVIFTSIGNLVASLPQSKRIPLFAFNAWGMGYGSVFLLCYALLFGEPIAFDARLPYIASLFYLAIPGTVIAFSIFIWLIGKIGIAKAAYIAVLVPLVALTVSTIFEGFIWTTEAKVGLALVMAGNIAMAKKKIPSSTKATAKAEELKDAA